MSENAHSTGGTYREKVQEAILWGPDRPSVDMVYDQLNGDDFEISAKNWVDFLHHVHGRGVCLQLGENKFMDYDGRYRLDGQPLPNRLDGLNHVSATDIVNGFEAVRPVLIEDTPFGNDRTQDTDADQSTSNEESDK